MGFECTLAPPTSEAIEQVLHEEQYIEKPQKQGDANAAARTKRRRKRRKKLALEQQEAETQKQAKKQNDLFDR
jgi:hypothetical protein